jgi:hypothetical protein
MVGAATTSALCWLYLDPENADRKPVDVTGAAELASTPIANS